MQRDDPSEDHGYNAFIADKDMIVMERGTYEKAPSFDAWYYDRPVLVVSRQLAGTAVPDALTGKVRFTAAGPREIMGELASQNAQRIYVDGDQLVQSFLREGLVTDLVITSDCIPRRATDHPLPLKRLMADMPYRGV